MNNNSESMKPSRCWTEIDLDQLQKNLRIYKSALENSMEIMAVVKADAYGHGDAVVAKYLANFGVHNFAVSNIDEAIHVREVVSECQILILGYTPISRVEDLIKYDITQALISEDYAIMLAKTKLPIKAQFALDTGMRRIGLNADFPAYCERVIRADYSNLIINGLFTHLCVADSDIKEHRKFTQGQIAKFEAICSRVRDLNFPYCHCMNSAGGIWHASTASQFARLGIILYGLKPDYLNQLPNGIKPVLSWMSEVSMVKEVYPGDSIGYGRTFIVEKDMRIATISTGYADGYNRLLSNRGWVLIKGKRAPIVGRVCMDQMMVDVTDIPDVKLGDEVILIGESGKENITADDLANLCGTIGYEVVCNISKRVERFYTNNE